MSVFTDGEAITPQQIIAIDGSVQSVAASEKIILSGPSSVIRAACSDVGAQLLEWMKTFDNTFANFQNPVMFVGSSQSERSRWQLHQVVTSWQYAGLDNPLARYMAYYALELFWKQAARRIKGDRYVEKLGLAVEDLDAARARLWSRGIPIVFQPLAAPGAVFDPSAGSWQPSNCAVSGAETDSPVALDVAITWVDQTAYISPTQNGNAESGPSPIQTMQFASGQTLTVSIASLNPPGTIPYQGGIADGVKYFRTATGWNVYAGASGETLWLQNPAPLPLTQRTFSMEYESIATEFPMGPGQVPDRNERPRRVFSRA